MKDKLENITVMRERHKREIKKLQDSCEHEEVSEFMPHEIMPGHCTCWVRVCLNCDKRMITLGAEIPL